MNELDRTNVKMIKDIKIPSTDSPICIQNVLDKKIVFALINEQDIVVADQKQLMMVIDRLSDHFSIINNSTKKIKT